MKIEEIDKVCFIGGGTMGCFNSLMAAAAGYQAVIFDVSADALKGASEVLPGMAEFLSEQGLFSSDVVPEALARIELCSDLTEAVSHADLVSESVSERLDIKRQVHRQLGELCNPGTLITTNTSGLPVSQIEDVVADGQRFAALHSHLASVLFDIVGGPRTSEQTIDCLRRYVLSLGGVPLVLRKENPGYVINAMLGPLLTISQILVIEGLASTEDVDGAWMRHQQATIGPFGLMDFFGLNIIHDSWQKPRAESAQIQDRILGFLAPYLERNALGVKTGEGFYSYPDPTYSQPGFIRQDSDDSFVYRVMICVLIVNAIVIASNEVAPPYEIDRAWMVSFKLPRGPFGTLDEMGIDHFMQACLELVELGLVPRAGVDVATEYLAPFIRENTLGKASGRGFYTYPEPEYAAVDFLTVA